MNPPRISLSPPHLSGAEQAYITQAFASNWVTSMGANVDGFESDITFTTKCGYAVALNSGTSAIHLALRILNIEPGDFVLCPTLTFTATAAPITYLKGIPVFIDSEADTFNMDPDICEETIKKMILRNKKPKAMLVVHLYGMPAKIEKLLRLSKLYDIPLIEDAAEALGSTYNNQACGTFGEVGIYSFNGNKIITTGGGGALVTANPFLEKRARYLSNHARELLPHYHHQEVGYNYRLSNISAGIGRGQLSVLGDRIAARKRNFEKYKKYFQNNEGVNMQEAPDSLFNSNRWLTSILLEPEFYKKADKNLLMDSFEAANIETRPLWKPLHLQPAYKGFPFRGGMVAEDLFNKGICLPSGSNMRESDFERIFAVFETVQKVLLGA
ncbi:aminotransferase class I/II-fold pyridoxal phosphate-dependent enzyme [Litoribacter alkaliphilus]|uniref:Aminotransferase class I/II-fold pyridoxal phosphate-dependent enzyme n=1 Tax=Litoribacter ruber TaxID=702568 RepID=A0AAP2G0V4_9BACT|nr:aminotransferase class I/II-fold pyridoxal phosphate-dependent enzyme [Litoribacter alkaliphilus]MBS9522997.1 aminotransferase class I/II-fold pyridoxal phosphate-dependent enzyme [Litoribacter alkaliphilus]